MPRFHEQVRFSFNGREMRFAQLTLDNLVKILALFEIRNPDILATLAIQTVHYGPLG